ncbi:MAG: discoidin domain-containing protein [Bacteroidaceae bacterium]|nr:discoidin domain-containing protein [Bacteroidaceae bacterium]
MKRKITFYAALLLSCLMAVPALADQQSLTGIGNYLTVPEEGKYYVIQGNGQHDNIVSWLFDNDGTFAATASSEVPTGPDALKYVWTFEVSDDGYAAKNLSTGRYIFIEGTSSGGNIKMRTEPAYFTIEEGTDENEGYVAFKNANGQCIDMGYSGVGPVSWSGGATGSRRLTIYEAVIEAVEDLEVALSRLNTCFGKYEQYLPNWGSATFDRGTEIGQYNCSDEVHDLFLSNLKKAHEILDETIPASEVTVEMINALIQDIEDGYDAIMASLVKLTIADGNYRIVSALEWTNTEQRETGEYDEQDNPIYETVDTHPTKAMYATLEGKAMWANIDSTDCRYLWKMTNNPETGFVKMMNIATDGILATCSQSTQATLTEDSETEMKFEYIQRTEDGKVVVAMKPSTGGDYAYLHCNGHSSGSGKASNIVGWTSSAGASNWILEPVSDEEAQKLIDDYAPIKDHELLVSMFQDLISETEAAIAKSKDDTYITERSAGLITSTSQFSSPWTESSEGSLDNLLTDDASTFWHSAWSGGNVANHTHYLQVSFEEPIEGNIQCFVRRRNVVNDHVTYLGVFGSNDASVLESTSEDGWTELGTYDLSKNASSGQTVYSNSIEFPEGYQYLRFYIDGTTTGRGYGHFATFQLYSLTIDGNTQWSQLGEAATAIETALNTAKELDQDEMVKSDLDALQAALDEFKPLLVDLSDLAAAINANKNVTDVVVVGENPGFWNESSEVGSLANTIAEATAYLKGGVYTQSQIDAYTEAITKSADDIFATANPVVAGKWYAFKFDSEENYDARQWSKAGVVNETLGDLYNNYVAPANVEEDNLVGFQSLEEVTIGQGVRFISEDIIEQMDQIAFRFIAQGDSAYVIQHKSGLYLNGAARSTTLTLGLAPALFNVAAVGYGKVIIEARDLKGQGYYTEPVYLHAQNAGHSLVTWNAKDASSNSGLYIEPISEGDFSEGDDVQESVMMSVKPNSMRIWCYPVGFSVTDGQLYEYKGAYQKDDAWHYAFNKIDAAKAGQPVLYVNGDVADFDKEAENEEESLTLATTGFAPDALQEDGFYGTYIYQWVDPGVIVVYGGDIASWGNNLVEATGKENTDCTRDVSANTGYIVPEENVISEGSYDLEFVIEGESTSIQQLISDINNPNTVIYNLAGQRVGKAQKGIYIINGKKVAIK